MKTISTMAISLGLAAGLLATAAFAHGDHDPDQGKQKPPPFAILQLDQVRDATARFRDVEKAEAAGYHDIGLFVPNMGWHYMKDALVDCFANGLRDDDILLMPEPVYFGGTVDRSVGSGQIILEIKRRGRNAFAFPDRSACGDALVNWTRCGDRIVIMGARDDSLSQFAQEILQRFTARTA